MNTPSAQDHGVFQRGREAFFDELADYLFIADENGCITDANAAALRKLGYPIEALRGRLLCDVFHTEQRAAVAEQIRKTLEGQPERSNGRLVDAGGSAVPVDSTFCRSVLDGAATIHCINKDVSSHLEANEKFLKIFANSPVSIAISNIDTAEYIDVNDAFIETIGYDKAEVIGRKVRDLKLFVDQSVRDRIVADALAYGHVRNREVQIRDRQGYIHSGYFSATSAKIGGERLLLASFNDMTYAQKSEQEKTAIEAQMRAVQDNMPFISWLKDIGGHYIGINRLFEKAVGKTAAEIIGKSDGDVWPAAAAKEYGRSDAEALATGERVFYEAQFHDVTGDQWYEIHVSPIFDSRKQIIGTAGISKTITEQKKLEIELKNQKKMLKSMIDVIPDLIFYKDINSVYLGCNSAFSDKFIGLSEEEIVGKTDLHFVKDIELANFFREKDRIVLAATETISNEETITLADGSVVDIETAKTPFFDESGQVAGLIGVSRDITARIAAQKELEHKEKLLSCVAASIKELLYERNYYEAIQRCFDRLGATMDVNRICLFQNGADHSASLKAEWFSAGGAAHRKDPLLQNIPEDVIREFVAPLAQGRIFAGNAADFEWGAFTNCIERDEAKSIVAVPLFVERVFWGFIVFEECKRERVWTDSEYSMLKAFAGSLEKAVERSQIEEELKRSKSLAVASNQAKSAFLSNMNHELRTPLNAILGFSELLTREKGLSEHARDNLRIIRRSGEHLLSLINDVLNLSKIEAGHIALNNQTYDLHYLLKYLAEIFTQKAVSKNLSFEMHQGSDIPRYVFGDEIKLRQILMNLLSNAVKFTEKGKVVLSVVNGLQAPEADDRVALTFTVTDTGPGIAASEMKDLFTPFVQTKTGKESKEGTGLGLAISRNFITLMGGELRVTSEYGQGMVFEFTVEMKKGSADQTSVAMAEQRIVSLESDQPAFRLLVVDDIDDNRQLLKSMLAPYGFILKEAQNGKEAIDIWQTWKPHLIWMDVRMPVMDGYEATKIIKELEETRHVPQDQRTVIIGVSASTFDEEREIVLNSGFDDFMRKPVNESVLFDHMHRHIGLRYICEDTGAANTLEQSGSRPAYSNDRAQVDLAALPQKLVQDLAGAAESLNMRDMETCIASIRILNGILADALAEMADDFRYDEILKIIPRLPENLA